MLRVIKVSRTSAGSDPVMRGNMSPCQSVLYGLLSMELGHGVHVSPSDWMVMNVHDCMCDQPHARKTRPDTRLPKPRAGGQGK